MKSQSPFVAFINRILVGRARPRRAHRAASMECFEPRIVLSATTGTEDPGTEDPTVDGTDSTMTPTDDTGSTSGDPTTDGTDTTMTPTNDEPPFDDPTLTPPPIIVDVTWNVAQEAVMIRGSVYSDDPNLYIGSTVVFGGVLEGYSAPIDADGNFELEVALWYEGLVTAYVNDSNDNLSELYEFYLAA